MCMQIPGLLAFRHAIFSSSLKTSRSHLMIFKCTFAMWLLNVCLITRQICVKEICNQRWRWRLMTIKENFKIAWTFLVSTLRGVSLLCSCSLCCHTLWEELFRDNTGHGLDRSVKHLPLSKQANQAANVLHCMFNCLFFLTDCRTAPVWLWWVTCQRILMFHQALKTLKLSLPLAF